MVKREVKLGQDVEITFNSKSNEKQKFCVVDIQGDRISMKAHVIGEDEVYDITIELLPTMYVGKDSMKDE